MSSPHLYAIHLTGPQTAFDLSQFDDACQLGETLFLVRSGGSRSDVYHAVKQSCTPDSLFVARVKGKPKFKGLADGALKWLRSFD
ncbi:hypothetical protein [Maricaulis sp. CAU 1757]